MRSRVTKSLLADYPELMLRTEVSEVLRVDVNTLGDGAARGVGPRCVSLAPRVPRYWKVVLVDYLEGL